MLNAAEQSIESEVAAEVAFDAARPPDVAALCAVEVFVTPAVPMLCAVEIKTD